MEWTNSVIFIAIAIVFVLAAIGIIRKNSRCEEKSPNQDVWSLKSLNSYNLNHFLHKKVSFQRTMSSDSSTSSESVYPKVIPRCSFIFEYANEARDFVTKIGHIHRMHPDCLLRLDFESEYLHLLVRFDIR